MKYYYRICEKKDDKLYTLFHALGEPRSRELPLGEWLKAEVKSVWDGSRKTAKRYTSGFHVFETPEECEGFIGLFRKPRHLVMVKVEIGDRTWSKEHSRANVILADEMRVVEEIKRLK